ncbi:uncharacterized protein LOC123897634 [Trifolium pratense]|uniref:uncharacterized protein LOC123897634 n=1 Tax=Trifolium pratense TaxID=57577 RepID=UPI001E6942E5|nr:uncharacterized protein LOC123897634 [Trifolium pratense]
MTQWLHIHVAVVASLIGCFSTLLFVFIWRLCHDKKDEKKFVESNSLTRIESHERRFDQRIKKKGYGRKDLFSWIDHPYLASDAVENGWSRFAFIIYNSSISMSSKKSTSSTLLGACVSGEYGIENEAEISWEVCQGSNEFMQKIRLNPGLKMCLNNTFTTSVASVIRTSLPLPGPSLGNHAFPQEAYFEITVLYSCGGDDHELVGRKEGEKTKLLIEDSSNDEGGLKSVEEMKVEGKESGKSGSVMLSLGLTAGESVPLRVPGTYPRSIGFNSNGSVFLDGMKLVFESDKAQWVGTDTVIGCGFDPRKRKVFFTLDSELVHVIHCQTEEYSTPLYPTLTANIDIMVLVNFGQIAFKYAPANAQRTPNPCFIAPLVHSPGATLGFDDSKELFSMGRIDSPWQNQSATKGNHNNGNNNNVAFDFDEESEADLFEIVLDGSEKSPYSVSLS